MRLDSYQTKSHSRSRLFIFEWGKLARMRGLSESVRSAILSSPIVLKTKKSLSYPQKRRELQQIAEICGCYLCSSATRVTTLDSLRQFSEVISVGMHVPAQRGLLQSESLPSPRKRLESPPRCLSVDSCNESTVRMQHSAVKGTFAGQISMISDLTT